MSDSTVLREFLVSLGFRVDKSSQEAFTKGLFGATTGAVALGDSIAKTAEAVAKAVLKMAQDLDSLYFTSRRVNAAAENIKAFGFAMTQLGGTAQGAQAALEGIASFMRSNPGGERFIQGLGVATREANGQLRDTEKITEDLGKRFREMPFYVAKARAAMLGIDERSLLALENPQLGAETQKYRQFAQLFGLGPDWANQSNQFFTKLRDIQAEFEIILIALTAKFLPVMQKVVDWLSKLPFQVEAFKRTALGRSLVEAAVAGGRLWDAVSKLIDTFLHLQIVGTAVNMMLGVATGTMNIISGLILTITDLLQGKWSDAWNDAKSVVSSIVGTIVGIVKAATRAVQELWYAVAHHGAAMPGGDQPFDASHNQSVIAEAGRDAAEARADIAKQQQALAESRLWIGPGQQEAQAKINARIAADARRLAEADAIIARANREIVEQRRHAAPGDAPGLGDPGPDGGILGPRTKLAQAVTDYMISRGVKASTSKAIGAGVYAEGGGLGYANNGAFGIGQWRGERLQKLFATYGTHPSFAQQVAFLLAELRGGDKGGAAVLNAPNASAALWAYADKFMRPDLPGEGHRHAMEDYNRGRGLLGAGSAAGVTISQKTEINIHGVSDPASAGHTVLTAQRRVNSNLVRNLKTSVA